jgi:hypothetical protein
MVPLIARKLVPSNDKIYILTVIHFPGGAVFWSIFDSKGLLNEQQE